MSQEVLSPARVQEIHKQAARRRTFAVISHPDAGKSTLTEALALHAKVIGTAGASSGKANRKETVSDWMQMEKDRGISISSAALQFAYRDTVINLLDTPGHADFSEDTYRVLAAVDCAVMLVDAAKGLETQTMKLFEVCKQRNLPIITVINKWDRPGLDALALMDEITERTGLQPMPLTWAVGISGDFRGVWDLRSDRFAQFKRNNAGANIALTEYFTPDEAAASQGADWSNAVDEAGLVIESNLGFDVEAFHAGKATPILFSSAALNFGVKEILDALVDFAPPAAPRPDVDGDARPVDAPFAGFVFKVQAGMNKAHRDHVAFIRVCSGVFERGMVVTQGRTGKSFATKYAQQVFGREREVIDEAFPGDVVGLVECFLAPGGRQPVPGLARGIPGHPALRARNISRWRARRTPAASNSSAAASNSSSTRASSRCSAPTSEATRHRCSPPSGPCSSKWSKTAWRTTSAPPCGWSGCRIPWPGSHGGRHARAGQRARRRGAAALGRRIPGAVQRRLGTAPDRKEPPGPDPGADRHAQPRKVGARPRRTVRQPAGRGRTAGNALRRATISKLTNYEGAGFCRARGSPCLT